MGTTDHEPYSLLLKNGVNSHNIKQLHEKLTIRIQHLDRFLVQHFNPNNRAQL
jgi:hypothetical protein